MQIIYCIFIRIVADCILLLNGFVYLLSNYGIYSYVIFIVVLCIYEIDGVFFVNFVFVHLYSSVLC